MKNIKLLSSVLLLLLCCAPAIKSPTEAPAETGYYTYGGNDEIEISFKKLFSLVEKRLGRYTIETSQKSKIRTGEGRAYYGLILTEPKGKRKSWLVARIMKYIGGGTCTLRLECHWEVPEISQTRRQKLSKNTLEKLELKYASYSQKLARRYVRRVRGLYLAIIEASEEW